MEKLTKEQTDFLDEIFEMEVDTFREKYGPDLGPECCGCGYPLFDCRCPFPKVIKEGEEK